MKAAWLSAPLIACGLLGCSNRAARSADSGSSGFAAVTPGLTAKGGAADDFFGFSVALSGSTAVIGAPRHRVGEQPEQGEVFVWVNEDDSWRLQASLTGDDSGANDHFGLSVAVSGDIVLVGAPGHTVDEEPFRGSAYVFVREGETWAQQGPSLSSNDGAAADGFGSAVAVASNANDARAVIGAPNHDVDGRGDQGAAYAFQRADGGAWSQRGVTLIANNGNAGEIFGSTVALSGTTALIGAPVHQVGANPYQGGVYVFEDDGTNWTQRGQELTAEDGGPFDQLSPCAIVGDWALLGAPLHVVDNHPLRGAAYLFSRHGAAFQQEARLTAKDGVDSDQFGSSVALSGSAALIGAPGHHALAGGPGGGVYFFAPDALGKWGQRGAVWSAPEGIPQEVFGTAVALLENSALVGAPYHRVGENRAQGAAYLYQAPSLPR